MPADSPSFRQSLDRPTAPSLGAGLARIPLFHAAWIFAAGITLARWVWLRPGLVLIALVILAAVSVLAAYRAQRVVWIPLAVLWCLLGAWCALMEPHPVSAPQLALLSDGLMRSVEGTVIDAGPVRAEIEQDLDQPSASLRPSQRVDLRISTLEVVNEDSDARSPVQGNIRLTVRWPTPRASGQAPRPFHCGEHLRADIRLLQPEIYRDPGVWNRQEFLVDQGITSTATLDAERIELLSASSPRSIACVLGTLQRLSTARMLALPAAMRNFPAPLRLTPDDAIMLSAMVSGDRTYLTHSLRVGFERTGSFHMLVVSGFHLAIVAACIFYVARRLRIPQFPATLVTIAASFTYALFTGFATPVQRSLWMVTLYLLARLFFRERSPLNTIGFAALCLLAASPRSLFDSGLQMTLLAVVSIAGIAAPLLGATIHPYLIATRDLRLTAIDVKFSPQLGHFRETVRVFCGACQTTRLERFGWHAIPFVVRLLLRVMELLVVSCIVELAMALPMALYFHRITLFALPVNLLILPLLTIIMPAALLTLITALLWPPAAVVPAMFVALPLHFGVWLVHRFGTLTFADLRIPAPLLLQSAIFCALLAAAIVLARGNKWARRAAWAAMLLGAVAALFPRPVQHPHDALLVETIDVGQGDSILLITPDGKSLLIDGGGFGGGPHQAPQDFDIGEEVVSEALWSRGIHHLDAVALTHAHSDHMGGLPAVLRNFHPRELWVGNNPRIAAYKALLAEATQFGVLIRSFRAGDSIVLGQAQITVLAPLRDHQPGAEPTNNDSLVLRAAYRVTSVMLEGDAEAPVEDAMLAESGLASTLLKVGHHGSLTSSRPEFLDRVAPQWAVISCGLHNRYGHPRREVLASLQSRNIRTYSTDINGAVCFQLNGLSVTADPTCARPQSP